MKEWGNRGKGRQRNLDRSSGLSSLSEGGAMMRKLLVLCQNWILG